MGRACVADETPTDPRTFPKGDEFIPERWTTEPELVKNSTPFAPFSVGALQNHSITPRVANADPKTQVGSPVSASSWA